MAQVARAQTEAAGGARAPASACRCSSAAWACPSRRSSSRGTVREADDGRAVVDTVAEQGGKQIIRNAEAELELVAPPGCPPARAYNQPACSRPARSGSCARSSTATCERASRWRSKSIAADPELECGPSTVRNELALLEEHGLLAHPHVSAGRVPTDAGHRYVVDRLLAPGSGCRPPREPRWSCR